MIDPILLKGFRDSLPKEEKAKKKIERKLEDIFSLYGFQPIDTPVLEYESVLLGKGGGETDKQIFHFEDNGGRKVAMRFDLTVPFARFLALHYSELSFPFKRYHIAKAWRGENPQKGRYREFIQCDFDIVGVDSAEADVEILSLMNASFKTLGNSCNFPYLALGTSSYFLISSPPRISSNFLGTALNLNKLLGILYEHFSGDFASLDSLYQFLNVKVTAMDDEDALYPDDLDPDAGVVEIMTVHKAKGLEFDTVVMPFTGQLFGAGKRKRAQEKETTMKGATEVLSQMNADGRLCVGWKRGKYSNQLYVEGLDAEEQAIRRDEARLLYVALTRAKCNLIVTTPADIEPDSWAEFLTDEV